MKISLGSWAFSFGPYAENPVPLDATVKRLAAAGYDGIELCGFPPHVTLENYPDPSSRRELAAFLQHYGLGISGFAADLSSVNPADDGNQQRYLDLFARQVELCRDIGSPSIRVDSVAAPGSVADRQYHATFDRMAALWRKAAQIASDEGVRMVWEFEPGFLFNKPSEIIGMHQRVGHPNFRILFDTAHAYMCAVVGARQHGAKDVLIGGVEELLRKLDGRIGAIHLIDNDGTLHGDETSTHRPFGQGHLDFHSLMPRLLAVPNIDWWCIDMCFWAGSWELVESSRDFVAHLLKERTVVAG
ncbi:MAG TPA: sugar phosphate isomerase/epimerase [Solibacterales bacterium]|jgi:sugar phosphate isomerase/epimerase|nr:sugar phosphate isomerase/epimerase [Bryobacterales bacterium]